MSFHWRYEDETGAQVDGPGERFDEQALAEEWLSEHWPDLADQGVDQVTLLDASEVVYGPMSLHA